MAEHVPPHVALNAHAHNVPPILDDVVEHSLYKVNAEQHAGPDQKQPEILVWHIIVDDVSRDDRVKQVAHRNDERAGHVDGKQLPVRLIVRNEALYKVHGAGKPSLRD